MPRLSTPPKPMPTNTKQDPLDLDEKVFLKHKCTRFESVVVKVQTQVTMMMGYRLNVMTQAPHMENQANLPQCIPYEELLGTPGW